ncbi:hypothetical protein MPLDJ20_210002 [Mesorhizobium plurifarium]|uniref:Uncharacterized protein n=1 Tax=Mesorhizobium plurifarium TaxID=69974 RepID=A0A090F1E1_MESPL|nr:hypothetical protein MPLDJ20_210002 [Mesorhizobium plurifarium]
MKCQAYGKIMALGSRCHIFNHKLLA